jgi:8-oxo-dGTP pyrophosphatase MutT (NUDIX family)
MAETSDFVRQAAALPVRGKQVCLVTSSNGKRWVIPKGLIDPGHTAGEAALKEAWEEAGLTGVLRPEPVGSYVYDKWGKTCHVIVFYLAVTEVFDEWPEQRVRQRAWVSFADAVDRMDEPSLREVMRAALKGAAKGG